MSLPMVGVGEVVVVVVVGEMAVVVGELGV